MMLDPKDKNRLLHIMAACDEALLFSSQYEREDLDENRMLVWALVKELEIIGEAVNVLTPEFKKSHTEVAWGDIVGMRNRLVHVYFDVDLDILWDTVLIHLPILRQQVQLLLEGF